MADTAIAITAGTGTNVDTRTEATNGNHRQVVVLGDPATNAGVAPVDVTNGLSVTLTTALPAGSAAIGKLAANSGVDIGDVDVTTVGTITPGTTATSLGKAEDAVAASGDVGVMALAVRADTAAATGANGDYVPLLTDSAGKLHVNVGNTVTVDASGFAVPVTDNAGSLTVDGSVTVTQGTGTNLHTVVDSGTITTVSSVTAIANALPAGTNAIGKLAANSGVDIGDVDVTTVGTITPGTAATSLAKAEDAAHSSGDVGVATWAVSNENLTAFGAASGDYAPTAVNRYGQHYVTTPPPSHASSNGTPITATTTSVIAAPSAGNHLRVVRIHMSNGGSTATWVAVRDGAAGTQHYRTYLPQNGVMSLNLNLSGPLDLTTATRLDIVLSAAGSVEYEIDYLTVAD